jgi:hypothetical protein
MLKNYERKQSFGPVAVAAAVAAFGLLSLVIVDHGPGRRPHAQSPETVSLTSNYTDTAAAARAAGATVSPTDPKSEIEPVAPGPKPSQPANPAPG